jgi:hypothetical protein
VPEQVLALKVPAVSLAAWYHSHLFVAASTIIIFDFSFASSARGIIVVGTADGSLHLINPDSWRCHIRQIQAHRLYASTFPLMNARSITFS